MAIGGRSGLQEGLRDGLGARKVLGQAEAAVVEAEHGDIAQRGRAALVVAPVEHLGGGQGGVLGDHGSQAAHVAVVQQLATADFNLEARPAREAVVAGDGELGGGEDEPVRHRPDPVEGAIGTFLRNAEKILGLVAEMVDVRSSGKQAGHDVSFVAGGPRVRPRRSS
jgi:hypothetical protein